MPAMISSIKIAGVNEPVNLFKRTYKNQFSSRFTNDGLELTYHGPEIVFPLHDNPNDVFGEEIKNEKICEGDMFANDTKEINFDSPDEAQKIQVVHAFLWRRKNLYLFDWRRKKIL
jgi:hypothetical protein